MWYKLKIIHGPGHQGTLVSYHYFEKKLDKQSERYFIDDEINRKQLYDAICKMSIVNSPPEEDINRMICQHQCSKRYDEKMIRILKSIKHEKL